MPTPDHHAAAAAALRATLARCVRSLILELEREGRAQMRLAGALRERAKHAGLA